MSESNPNAPKKCEGSRHYFDIIDGKPVMVCRCGKLDRSKRMMT